MNFFESFGAHIKNVNEETLKAEGLQGICTKCEGEGRVSAGLLKKRVCGECHGKGFVKDDASQKEAYDWNTGKLH